MRGSLSVVGDLGRARSLYEAARFGDALVAVESNLAVAPSSEAAILCARLQLKVGRPEDALATLARYRKHFRTDAQIAESSLVKGVAYARLGDAKSAQSAFSHSRKLLERDSDLALELQYQTSAALWIERKLGAASKALDALPKTLPPDIDVQASILRGAIAAAGERLPEQGSILLDALRRIDKDAVNVHYYAVLATNIASLAVELPSTALRDAAMATQGTVAWTDDLADLHFHTVRALAWIHALAGDEFNAFRRLKEAAAVVKADPWRVAAITDRAYLATAMGESRWAAQELRDAHELASSIDWSSVEGEEKLALPVLADLFAERDQTVAVGYVSLFQKIGKSFPRVLSSSRDRRVRALETYSLGRVQAALGETREAERLLKEAWAIYNELGIAWRAARAALALRELTGEERWEIHAREALSHYPNSWLARSANISTNQLPARQSEALQSLTPSQRTVLDLILSGKNTKQMAKALGRSEFTIKNHIRAILKAFGAPSRSALIVKVSGG